MKKILKIGLIFAVILSLYFIPALLFKTDTAYYNSLKKPNFAPPALLFGIFWPILYTIFSLYLAIKLYNKSLTLEVGIYFAINYVISFFFNKVFFVDHKLFLTFSVTIASFVSGLFIFIATFKGKKYEFLVILPYILWTLFATILMANIYLIN